MDAVDVINDNLDVYKLLEYYEFDNVSDHGSTIRSSCKIHGGDQPTAFVINKESGLWFCHTGDCGGGDAYTLVQRLEECNFKESVEILSKVQDIDIDNLQINSKRREHKREVDEWVEIMKRRISKVESKEFKLEEEVKKVLKFREFQEETLRYFNFGFAKEVSLSRKDGSKYRLFNRLVVPIVQDKINIGVSLRRTKPTDYPKWSHQPINIKTGDLLYNIDAIKPLEEVVVVEGPFDVWAYHEIGVKAVATYGAKMNKGQIELLIKTGGNIILSFDGDEAGKQATREAIKELIQKANIYVVKLLEEEDPESISRERLKELYESRERI